MARKARQRISYVLPLANSAGGHRLGVNGLAVDSDAAVLYSGGRDGVINAWDLNYDLQRAALPEHDAKLSPAPATTFRQKVQAHTHWINDIALVQNNQALVSASSDITVKLWRPAAADRMPPQTLGLHSDYVKTLAVPSQNSDWIASGSLDRKINLWDLSGAGQKLSIDVGEDETGSMLSKEKASVYALAATETTLASGGPQRTVKLWDTRTGKRITQLVGHVDNVRDLLISQDGTTVITASSDHTVKVWSAIAGRCMFTLTMHDEAVWSLFSSDPDLSIFYSSDKNGLVAKTDTRNTIELDEGLSIAVCQEHEGVHKVVAAGDSIWTGTRRPSINRWRDVETANAEIDVPENCNIHRASFSAQWSRHSAFPSHRDSMHSLSRSISGGHKRKIPLKYMLRLSNAANFAVPVLDGERKGNTDRPNSPPNLMTAVRTTPDYSIEGQNGLKQGTLLNDRRRALTVDTAGDVVLWDLLRCVPIQSFGKRHLDEVKEELTTNEMVANWCSIDTRTGSLAVVLEEHTCFDAEIYADELDLDTDLDFREDQRINLGKWVLRYLFSNLISEEIERDELYRQQLLGASNRQTLQRENAPSSIHIPPVHMNGWNQDSSAPQTASTIRPGTNGHSKAAVNTPGLNIGLATPGILTSSSTVVNSAAVSSLPTAAEERRTPNPADSQPQPSERERDYFSSSSGPHAELATPGDASLGINTPKDQQEPQTPTTENAPKDASTPGKESFFGKKRRIGMPTMNFSGMMKMGRNQANDKPQPAEEKDPHENGSQSSHTSGSRVVEENLWGTVQKLRFAYTDALQQQLAAQQARENGLPVAAIGKIDLPSAICPSLPIDTPVIKPPPQTTVLIQEDRPEAGGVADLFEGTVGSLGDMCDLVEKAAPMWLGEMLLRNQLPVKDVVKISFVLEPYLGLLPTIASDGNNRLNANRMLRAKKILGYVAERIEPGKQPGTEEAEQPPVMKPEEYLELWCQNQVVPLTMTLATIRSHLWRGGGDVILYYRANGKKAIPFTGTSGYPPTAALGNPMQDARLGAAAS